MRATATEIVLASLLALTTAGCTRKPAEDPRKAAPTVAQSPGPRAVDLSELDTACARNDECVLVDPARCAKCSCVDHAIATTAMKAFEAAVEGLDCSGPDPDPDIDCGGCMTYEAYCARGSCAAREGPSLQADGGPQAAYARWLGRREDDEGEVTEKDDLRLGTWRFFAVRREGDAGRVTLSDRAAVDDAGHVVSRAFGNWHAFLTTDGIDAASALQRVAWLFSARPLDEADGAHAPSLGRDADDEITFAGALTIPPQTKSVHRVVIVTTPTSGTTFDTQPAQLNE